MTDTATGTEQELPECQGCGRSTADQWYRNDSGVIMCECGFRERAVVREQVEEVLGL